MSPVLRRTSGLRKGCWHMLNDLLSIERALTAFGVALSSRHSDIKDMGKGGALRVRLGADGHIVSVEIVQESGSGAIWTLRDGQHNGFPGLKTGFPIKTAGKTEVRGLLRLDAVARQTHEQAWKAAADANTKRRELARLFDLGLFDHEAAEKWPNSGHKKRIAERLVTLRPLWARGSKRGHHQPVQRGAAVAPSRARGSARCRPVEVKF